MITTTMRVIQYDDNDHGDEDCDGDSVDYDVDDHAGVMRASTMMMHMRRIARGRSVCPAHQ